MRNSVLLAAVGLAVSASTATADFQITPTPSGSGQITSSVPGGTPGFILNAIETPGSTADLYKIFALNKGTGDQAGTANVLGITLNYHDTTGKGLQVRTVDNGDGTTSYVGAGTPSKWFTVEENGDTTTPGTAPGSALPDPSNFSNVHVVGLANFAGGGVLANSTVNNGLGAQIGQIVTNHDDIFSADGAIGAENGPQSLFRFEEPVPEPVALSLVGGGLGLLLRRSRSPR